MPRAKVECRFWKSPVGGPDAVVCLKCRHFAVVETTPDEALAKLREGCQLGESNFYVLAEAGDE